MGNALKYYWHVNGFSLLTGLSYLFRILYRNHTLLDCKRNDIRSQLTTCIQTISGNFFRFLRIPLGTSRRFDEPLSCKRNRRGRHRCLLERNSPRSQRNRRRFHRSRDRRRTDNDTSCCRTRNWRTDGSC